MAHYKYITLNLETNAFLCIGFIMPKVVREIYVNTFDYGGVSFFENGNPIFYFNHVEQEKEFLPVTNYCSENGIDLTELLAKILNLKGFKVSTDSGICKRGITIPLFSNRVLKYTIPVYPIEFFFDVKHLL